MIKRTAKKVGIKGKKISPHGIRHNLSIIYSKHY